MNTRTPSRDLVHAMQTAFASSSQAWPIARDFGLAAIGAKPVALRNHKCDSAGRLRYGFDGHLWDPLPLLCALRADGLSVFIDASARNTDAIVAVSLDAGLSALAAHLFEEAHERGVVGPDDLELRLGALFGYPKSGTLALLGRRKAADRQNILDRLAPQDRPFTGCKFASDEAGVRDALAYARRLGRAWRSAFGNLGYEEASMWSESGNMDRALTAPQTESLSGGYRSWLLSSQTR